MPFNIGPLELGIVLLIVLVIFGPKRLPGLGRSLGSGIREFKDSITGKSQDSADEDDRSRLIPADGPAADPSPSPAPSARPASAEKTESADGAAVEGEVVPDRRA